MSQCHRSTSGIMTRLSGAGFSVGEMSFSWSRLWPFREGGGWHAAKHLRPESNQNQTLMCIWERLLSEMSRLLSCCRWDGLHSMYNWLNKSCCQWVLLWKLCVVQKLHSHLTNCFHLDARHIQEVILGVTFSPCDEQTCRMTLMMRYFHQTLCEPSAKWITRQHLHIVSHVVIID